MTVELEARLHGCPTHPAHLVKGGNPLPRHDAQRDLRGTARAGGRTSSRLGLENRAQGGRIGKPGLIADMRIVGEDGRT